MRIPSSTTKLQVLLMAALAQSQAPATHDTDAAAQEKCQQSLILLNSHLMCYIIRL
jgi:hypothetical protein